MNGKDLSTATHQEAVMALIAPTYEIRVKVRHDPPPKGLQVRKIEFLTIFVPGKHSSIVITDEYQILVQELEMNPIGYWLRPPTL